MRIQHQGSRATGAHEALVVLRHESMAGTVLRLVGEIDLTSTVELVAALNSSGRGRRRVVVDMAQVAFLDSSGLAALLWGKRRLDAAGSELTLRAVSAPVGRLLRLADLTEHFGSADIRIAGRTRQCAHHRPGCAAGTPA